MIPRYFRKAEPWQLLMIFLLASLLWLPQLGRVTLEVCHHPRSIFCPLITAMNSSLGAGGIPGQIIAFLAIMGIGLFLIHVLSSNNLIEKATYFPAYVFVIFASHNISLLTLHPVIPALLLLLLALFFIFKAYEETSALKMMFSASFCISLASLFYFPVLGFGVLPWLSLLIFRDFAWRNWTTALIGLITPYLYTFAWIYIFKDQGMISTTYFSTPLLPAVPDLDYPWPVYIFWILTGSILLRSLLSILWHLNEKVISFRKKQLVMLWFLILSIITWLFSDDSAHTHSIILLVPLSFYLTAFFIQGRKKRISLDIVYIILLGSLVLAYLA